MHKPCWPLARKATATAALPWPGESSLGLLTPTVPCPGLLLHQGHSRVWWAGGVSPSPVTAQKALAELSIGTCLGI